MNWPKTWWIKFKMSLPTFGEKNPPKPKREQPLDRVVDWESRNRNLDAFKDLQTKRAEILRELREGRDEHFQED